MFGTTSEIHWTKDTLYSYLPEPNAYVKQVRPKDNAQLDAGMTGLESLFNDHNYFKSIGAATRTQFKGKPAFSVPVNRTYAGYPQPRRYTLYVDARTYLPLGHDEAGTYTRGFDQSVYNLTPKAKLTAKDFEWTPPKDATSATKE